MTKPKPSFKLIPLPRNRPDEPCRCAKPEFYFHDQEQKYRCLMCGGVPSLLDMNIDQTANYIIAQLAHELDSQ